MHACSLSSCGFGLHQLGSTAVSVHVVRIYCLCDFRKLFEQLMLQNKLQTRSERGKLHVNNEANQFVTDSFFSPFCIPVSVHHLHFSIPCLLSLLPPLSCSLFLFNAACPSSTLHCCSSPLPLPSFPFTVLLSLLQLLSSATPDQHQQQRGHLRHLHP